MRNWILRLHLYGGLLCSAYLIIFGISSLNFNHRFVFAQLHETEVTWERPLAIAPVTDNEKAAESIRDALGLMGWTIPWKMQRDREGNLQFDLERPGKGYTIRARVNEGRVKVEERRKGFWQVFDSLHALMFIPQSKFSLLWGWYTELCTWVVLFAGASGVCLWAASKRERRAGWLVLAGAVAASVGLMVYVVVRG